MDSIIVKVPGINGLGKTNGCEKAPDQILESLNEIYSNGQGKILDKNSLKTGEIDVDNSDVEETNKGIYKAALKILEGERRVVFLGGDHSVSYPLAKAFLESCDAKKRKPFLIVFDAHPDCMEAAGSSDSSRENQTPTHEDWLRSLVEAGFPAENILLVGSRNADGNEIKFLRENKINQIPMKSFAEDFEGTCDYITEFSSSADGDGELYVSIDVDFVDPAFAPGTGYREPGGLASREFLYIVQRINKVKNLKSVDIVEINPDRDASGMTAKLGAGILSEII